ncbi:chemotaxis protein CheB [Blastococcus sp. TF02-8]|uniref:chemotaxis protein CheB n=1 Tax=Blastococcus sp. TF02-8 TaxID=2250574 RepID=UPI000DE8A92F|nr:chemotaxis protein CheB [Blastococcus sp. TF02-8]RBY95833.1 chemotaxis protein CheB [Blastococcus sp. TF02-8]
MVAPPSSAPRGGFRVAALAASSGGVRALGAVAGGLPADFPVPVVVLQHRSPGTPDMLTDILRARGRLPVRTAATGPLQAGVTVLPARTTADLDRDGGLVLRPAPTLGGADHLFSSAAGAFGAGVLAVVLTGRLADGAEGVRAVRRVGGRVIVQHPDDAEAPGMPSAALATGCVEHALPLALVAPALVAYTMAPGGADLLAVPLPPWARLGPPFRTDPTTGVPSSLTVPGDDGIPSDRKGRRADDEPLPRPPAQRPPRTAARG